MVQFELQNDAYFFNAELWLTFFFNGQYSENSENRKFEMGQFSARKSLSKNMCFILFLVCWASMLNLGRPPGSSSLDYRHHDTCIKKQHDIKVHLYMVQKWEIQSECCRMLMRLRIRKLCGAHTFLKDYHARPDAPFLSTGGEPCFKSVSHAAV